MGRVSEVKKLEKIDFGEEHCRKRWKEKEKRDRRDRDGEDNATVNYKKAMCVEIRQMSNKSTEVYFLLSAA